MSGMGEMPDVDRGAAADPRPCRIALPERADGCRMDAGRASRPAGCQWRAVPEGLPPRSTVHDYLTRWTWDGTLGRLHHALFVQARERAGEEASPTAAIIDSQSVKSAEKGGAASTRAVTT